MIGGISDRQAGSSKHLPGVIFGMSRPFSQTFSNGDFPGRGSLVLMHQGLQWPPGATMLSLLLGDLPCSPNNNDMCVEMLQDSGFGSRPQALGTQSSWFFREVK